MRHIFFVTLSVFVVIATSAKAQGPLPDLDTLMEDIREAAARREQFLTHAQGYCDAVTQRGYPEHSDWTVPDALPPDNEGIRWGIPVNHGQTWYRHGEFRRIDTSYLRKAWRVIPEDRATTPSNVVDIGEGKGYLDNGPWHTNRLVDLPLRFDVHALFRHVINAPLERIEHKLNNGYQPTLTWSLVGSMPCVLLSFAPAAPDSSETRSQSWNDFHFAPSQDYALLKATIVDKFDRKSSNIPLFRAYQFVASYAALDGTENTWLCESIEVDLKEYMRGIEGPVYELGRVQARINYFPLGAQLSGKAFDFAGLGLPANAPLIDLRTGLSVAEDPSGLVIAPESEYLFTGLPTPIPVETANNIISDLKSDLKAQSQEHIHSIVRDRIDAPTPHAALYQRMALARLHRARGDTSSLLDYALQARDAVLVRALVEPNAPSFDHHAKEPSEAALELVEETIRTAPEELSPIHVEALHLAIDIRKPRDDNTAGTVPTGYNRAIALLCECLAHDSPSIQAAVLQYLPGRNVRTQTAFETVKTALQAYLDRDDTDANNGRAAAEKLGLLSDFASIHPAGLPYHLQW